MEIERFNRLFIEHLTSLIADLYLRLTGWFPHSFARWRLVLGRLSGGPYIFECLGGLLSFGCFCTESLPAPRFAAPKKQNR